MGYPIIMKIFIITIASMKFVDYPVVESIPYLFEVL